MLFDREFHAVVVAPMDNFKSAVHHSRANTSVPTWDTGVSSELTSLPRGFEHSTMLVAGRGITAALEKWGVALRTVHGTNRTEMDPNVEYLSYWTDNGGYMSGSAWPSPEGGNGGGTVVNEGNFRAVAKGLEGQGLLDAVKTWQARTVLVTTTALFVLVTTIDHPILSRSLFSSLFFSFLPSPPLPFGSVSSLS